MTFPGFQKVPRLAAGVWFAALSSIGAQSPPDQPRSGPGGAEYPHASIKKSGPHGRGARAYFLYEPGTPKPDRAPVVVFLHGYDLAGPARYEAWIHHLVRKGNTVVFPVYQARGTKVTDYTANALAAVKDALRRLSEGARHAHPEAGQFALAGHSLGGVIATNIAGLCAGEGLPVPKAVLLANPGDTHSSHPDIPPILLSPGLMPNLLLLGIAGAEDATVGDRTALEILEDATSVEGTNKNLIRLNSDGSGDADLLADHLAPLATVSKKHGIPSAPPDALDFFGYWKWLDALLDAAFSGIRREFALGDTPEQRFMGQWSDGRPVTEPGVITY